MREQIEGGFEGQDEEFLKRYNDLTFPDSNIKRLKSMFTPETNNISIHDLTDDSSKIKFNRLDQ